MRKLSGLCLVVAVAAVLPSAAGPKATSGRGVREPAMETTRLEAIVPTAEPDRTQVVVRSNAPVLYTSYAPDSATLVVELPGVDASALPAEIEIPGDAVDRLEVEHDVRSGGEPVARLSFRGLNVLSHSLRSEGTDLVVEFRPAPRYGFLPEPSSPAQSEAAKPVPPEPVPVSDAEVEVSPLPTPPAVPEPLPQPPASRLLGVEPLAVEGGVRVRLHGDGSFTYRTFSLENPDRVVLDLIGVRNALGARHLEVSSGPVEQIRVAQFRVEPEPVARVVVDLLQASAFEVDEEGDALTLLIGPAAPTGVRFPSPVEVPADRPAVAEAAAPASPPDPVALPEPAADLPATAPSRPQPAAVAAVEPVRGEVPLTLDELGLDPIAEADYVLFDQAQSPTETLQATVPPQFQSTTIAGERRTYTGERISVNFVEADLKNVFLFFAEFIGINIVIDPEVQGNLTMRLNQVPWDQAFDVILRHQGLEKIVEGNVVRIATTEKLRAEASQRQALKKAQEAEVDPVTFTQVLSYAKVDQVTPILLQGVKTDRGKVVQDARTNTLIITDVPAKRDAYQRLIDVLDTRTEQVMIEARIVETDRNFEHNLGIQWGFFASADPALGTQTNLDFPHRGTVTYDVNLPAPAAAGTLGLSLGNVLDSVTLDMALQAFENEGKVRILSSPKIATQNNKTAVIEQGTQIPVVTTTAVEINVQYISASLKLQVTPQITAEGTVIMDVAVENNSPDFVNRVGDVPPIITEKAVTQILVRDGGTAVIGGIFKTNESLAEAGIPGLKKIPGLGWLFKNRSITKTNTELLVFITPRILTQDA